MGQVGLTFAQTVSRLQTGGVVAVATESSFALASRYDSQSGIQSILQLKGGREGPIGLVAASEEQACTVWCDSPPAIVAQFWPGGLTWIGPAANAVSTELTNGNGEVGIRVPRHANLRSLCAAVGPLTATSANPSGESPAETAEQVGHYFPELPWFGVCGGSHQPSTLVIATPESASNESKFRILRQGAVRFAA